MPAAGPARHFAAAQYLAALGAKQTSAAMGHTHYWIPGRTGTSGIRQSPPPRRAPQSARRKCSRRGTCLRARGSRARRRRRSPRPRRPRRRRAAARRPACSTREDRSVSQPAERLAREDRELHGDQRPGRGIENPVRLGDADQLVAEILARRADRHHLRVLAELVVDLAVARHDLALELGRIDQRLAAELVHAGDQLGQRLGGSRNRRRAP